MSVNILSVFIIAKNEEDRIAAAIESVKAIAGEIIVVDSGSTDRTVDIAKALGARSVYNEWKGYGPQKVFGESLCANDWILNIDADEELSPELNKEIINLFNRPELMKYAGFRVKIVNRFFNEAHPKKLAYYYNQIRLYNRQYAGFKDSTVHDSVILKEDVSGALKIGQLKNIIEHQSFRSFEHWLEKINSYSTAQALDSFKKGKKPAILKVLFVPLVAFLKAYFIRRYFIYGLNGFIYSYIFAFGRLMKLAKTRSLFASKR